MPPDRAEAGLHPFAQIGFISLHISILAFRKRHSKLLTPEYPMPSRLASCVSRLTTR